MPGRAASRRFAKLRSRERQRPAFLAIKTPRVETDERVEPSRILLGASLHAAHLDGANLGAAQLTGATISQAQLDGACGEGAKLPPDLSLKPCVPSHWPL
jgi:hypothetical protein